VVNLLRRISFRGLRIRIVAWSFFPTMLITLAMAVFIYSAYTNLTEALLIEQNRDSARFEANQFTIELNEYSNLLTGEARVIGAAQSNQPFRPDVLVPSTNRFVVFDGGVVLLDNYGIVVATQPARPDILNSDWSSRAYYTGIAHFGVSVPAVFSDVVKDGPGGKDVIVVAVPVTDIKNRLVGVLAGMFRVEASAVSSFYGDIVKLNWGKGRNAYIFDSSGRIIYHTETNEIGKDVSGSTAAAEAVKGISDAIRTIDLKGRGVLASFAPVPGTPWGIVTEKNWATLTGSNRGYQTGLISLLIAGILVPAVIVFFGVKQITKPIAAVSRAAKEISGGNFSHRIKVTTGDELEEMATQFNTMAGALDDSYTTLERKVEDRTRRERQRADQLRAINETGRKISSILHIEELLPFVAKSLQETFKYESIRIYLADRNSGELTLKARAGYGLTSSIAETSAASSVTTAKSVVESGEPVILNKLILDAQQRTGKETGNPRAKMVFPIKLAGRTIGVLDVEESRTEVFDELDIFNAQTLADQLAIAIENARLYEHAQELATLEERNRLARDLHDAVSQTLFSASLIAEVLPRIWERNQDEGVKRLEEVRQLTRGALAEMRTLLLELRPAALSEAELPHLLTQLGESIRGRARIPVTINVVGQCLLTPDVKVAFYRIAQEALNNIAKHAQAHQVKVDLVCEMDKVTLSIRDDGKGFDTGNIRPESFGVGIMHERAAKIGATISVVSQPGHGTTIAIAWINSPGQPKQ
jgi:nitrate/nitrite-specific signal transduction histidine kinase